MAILGFWFGLWFVLYYTIMQFVQWGKKVLKPFTFLLISHTKEKNFKSKCDYKNGTKSV